MSRTSGRRSALTNLELVRPDHAVFFPPCSGFNVPISHGRRSDREKYIVYSCSLLVQKQVSFGDAHVVVECASDSLITKFLRVTLDTIWRARIDLCMFARQIFGQDRGSFSILRWERNDACWHGSQARWCLFRTTLWQPLINWIASTSDGANGKDEVIFRGRQC